MPDNFPTQYRLAQLSQTGADAATDAHTHDGVIDITRFGKPHAALVSDRAAGFLRYLRGDADKQAAGNYIKELVSRSPDQGAALTTRLNELQAMMQEAGTEVSRADRLGPRTGRGIID
jgi:hypothetical protein